MQLLWRSQPYTPDPTSAKNNNRADYNWLQENQPGKLVMEDICIWTSYFIRTQDFYYDIPVVPKEQYILCYNYNNPEYVHDFVPELADIIYLLQKRWYMVFFNSKENQSVHEVRHWHIIKF